MFEGQNSLFLKIPLRGPSPQYERFKGILLCTFYFLLWLPTIYYKWQNIIEHSFLLSFRIYLSSYLLVVSRQQMNQSWWFSGCYHDNCTWFPICQLSHIFNLLLSSSSSITYFLRIPYICQSGYIYIYNIWQIVATLLQWHVLWICFTKGWWCRLITCCTLLDQSLTLVFTISDTFLLSRAIVFSRLDNFLALITFLETVLFGWIFATT